MAVELVCNDFIVFSESLVGMQMLWVLGDNFTARSFRSHYKNQIPTRCNTHFIKENYEYMAHCSSRWSSTNENMLSRIRNSLVSGLNQQKTGLLPKYIIVVLDDDLITFLNFKEEGMATLLGTWIDWLVKEFNTLIESRKKQIPKKSYNDDLPFFYWVAAPTHSCFSKERNNLRIKFNLSLDSVIRAHQENMRIIRIKDLWNTSDSLLVINDRMTTMGLSAYWNAIDASFQFNSGK